MSSFPGRWALSNCAVSFSRPQTGSSPYRTKMIRWKTDSPWAPANCLCQPYPKWSRSPCPGIPAHTRCSSLQTSWMGQVKPLVELPVAFGTCSLAGLELLFGTTPSLWISWKWEWNCPIRTYLHLVCHSVSKRYFVILMSLKKTCPVFVLWGI